MAQLDEQLMKKARPPRQDSLALGERVAINLFWRRNVQVTVLAKVFQCGRNTIYGNCLTGDSASYNVGHRAREINELVDRMGVEKAWAMYVTDAMIRAVNAAHREAADRRAA